MRENRRDDIPAAAALDFIERAVLRRDRSIRVFRPLRPLARTVLRHRIINRNRDCRLFWTGLGSRCVAVTMKFPPPKETRSEKNKNLAVARTRQPTSRRNAGRRTYNCGRKFSTFLSPIAQNGRTLNELAYVRVSRESNVFFTI